MLHRYFDKSLFNSATSEPFFLSKCRYFAAKMNLQINQTFLSLPDFKEALCNWAIVDHFEYRWAFSDAQRAKAVCVHAPGCLFAVCCNWYKGLSIAQVTVLVSNHNCTGYPVVKRSQASRLDWILGALPTVLTVGPTTTPLAIIDAIKLHYRQLVPKQQA
jgi:formyltetrahydrofolate hydrolase